MNNISLETTIHNYWSERTQALPRVLNDLLNSKKYVADWLSPQLTSNLGDFDPIREHAKVFNPCDTTLIQAALDFQYGRGFTFLSEMLLNWDDAVWIGFIRAIARWKKLNHPLLHVLLQDLDSPDDPLRKTPLNAQQSSFASPAPYFKFFGK